MDPEDNFAFCILNFEFSSSFVIAQSSEKAYIDLTPYLPLSLARRGVHPEGIHPEGD